ncbi:hypothetical protein LguiB_031708 [Lonicera macranthoides]
MDVDNLSEIMQKTYVIIKPNLTINLDKNSSISQPTTPRILPSSTDPSDTPKNLKSNPPATQQEIFSIKNLNGISSLPGLIPFFNPPPFLQFPLPPIVPLPANLQLMVDLEYMTMPNSKF